MSKQYRYTLNENARDGKGELCNSMQLEGISFKKGGWFIHHSRMTELEKYIRTKKNPKGILDYQEYRSEIDVVEYDSREAFDEIPDKLYSMDELLLMEKYELAKIAKMYNISLIGKREKKIIRDIIEVQNEVIVKNNTD